MVFEIYQLYNRKAVFLEMNLYRISQEENINYETYDSAIVCAASEEDARNITPSLSGDWKMSYWASSPEKVKVELIGVALNDMKAGVVLASFNAG